MLREILLISFIFFISCKNDDLEDVIPDESSILLSDQDEENSKEDTEEDSEPNTIGLIWKKLTYKQYNRDYNINFPTDSVAFEKEGYISLIKENLGVVEFENNFYNYIHYNFPVTGFTISRAFNQYERDSLDYQINVRIDTLTVPNEIKNNTNTVTYNLIKQEGETYHYQRIERYKEPIAFNRKEVIIQLETHDIYINLNQTDQNIQVPAGDFISDEYFIRGKKTEEDKLREGVSIYYYSRDNFLVQFFHTFLNGKSYAFKEELIEIEY